MILLLFQFFTFALSPSSCLPHHTILHYKNAEQREVAQFVLNFLDANSRPLRPSQFASFLSPDFRPSIQTVQSYILFVKSLFKDSQIQFIGKGTESLVFRFKRNLIPSLQQSHLLSTLPQYVFKIPLLVQYESLSAHFISDSILIQQCQERIKSHFLHNQNEHQIIQHFKDSPLSPLPPCHCTFFFSPVFKITIQTNFNKDFFNIVDPTASIQFSEGPVRYQQTLLFIKRCMTWYQPLVESGVLPNDLSFNNLTFLEDKIFCFDFSYWTPLSNHPSQQHFPSIFNYILFSLTFLEYPRIKLDSFQKMLSSIFSFLPSRKAPPLLNYIQELKDFLSQHTHHFSPSFIYLFSTLIETLEKNCPSGSFNASSFYEDWINFCLTELQTTPTHLPSFTSKNSLQALSGHTCSEDELLDPLDCDYDMQTDSEPCLLSLDSTQDSRIYLNTIDDNKEMQTEDGLLNPLDCDYDMQTDSEPCLLSLDLTQGSRVYLNTIDNNKEMQTNEASPLSSPFNSLVFSDTCDTSYNPPIQKRKRKRTDDISSFDLPLKKEHLLDDFNLCSITQFA